MNYRLLVLAVCAAPLLLTGPGGCTTNPATGEQVFTGLMSREDEIRIGREQHPQIIKAFGGEYGTPALKHYVSSVGQLLARTVERKDLKYTFTILNSDIVNAFAMPGGYIYITRGLLALADDEAELAGVLGHELGHVNAMHHVQQANQQALAGLLVTGAGIGLGQAGSEVANLAASLWLPHYSREQESQADRLGIRYMSRAGYDPRAMADFLADLRAESQLQAKIQGRSPEEVDQLSYTASHPTPIERVQATTALAAATPVRHPMRARDIYLRKINGILYGDDPEQGFIRGRVFAHPKLRFRFEVPKGFHLFNSPKAVIAKGPDKAAIVFDTAPKPSDGPVRYYLTNVWARGAALRDVETLKINGLEAATAATRATVSGQPRDARLLAIRRNLQTIYRFVFLTPPGQAARWSVPFRRTTYSFRVLTESEAAALKPLRITTVRVAPGDTPQTLARRMADDDGYSLERFRVLNGLHGNRTIHPGEIVKIVTE